MICSTEEEFRLLLLRMLAPIRRSHETPLQFEIDSLRIAATAWAAFSTDYAERDLELPNNPAAVISILEGMMGRDPGEEKAAPADMVTSLANWLDCLFRRLRQIDPEAIEIASLRIEGLDTRSISEKLDTGLRLVNSIITEIGNCHGTVPEKEGESEPC